MLTLCSVLDDEPRQRSGTSIDQDGKSNVWPVDPKTSIEASGGTVAKVHEALFPLTYFANLKPMFQGAQVAAAAFAAVALAILVVSNLPDVDAL